MSSNPQANLEDRVRTAAQTILEVQHYVSALYLFNRLGWLPQAHIQDWRRGRLPCLQQVLQVNPEKIVRAIHLLHEWAQELGLRSEEFPFLARTVRGRQELRFCAVDDPVVEKIFRTHYFDSTLSEKEIDNLRNKLNEEPEIVVFWIVGDSQCGQCKTPLPKGRFLIMEADQPLCLTCAGLDQLVYLGRGDAALTRRARKYSSLAAVVVRFSRARKQYERQGILVEPEALHRAEQDLGREHSSQPEDYLPWSDPGSSSY